MALTYNKNIRDLSIKGTITMAGSGEQIHLTADDIINYSFDSSIGSEGLPLGSAEAANFTLEISNVDKAYTPAQFDNAEVHMYVGIMGVTDYEYTDFGVWYVESSTAPEQSVSIMLSGYDALATRFEALFEDDESNYPSTIGRIALDACLGSGITFMDPVDFPNAAIVVEKMPEWGEETTLRDVLSFCSICAGGYVRIARNGMLEIVSFADGNTYDINPDMYQTFTLNGGSAFKFNSIEAMLNEDDEEYARYIDDETVTSNATNTIQLDYNPLLTDAILQSIMTELKGITMDAGTLMWCGDPAVKCTDYFNVTMLDGTVHKIMITGQSFSFDGGLTATESCDLPAINTVSSATYSTSSNMYDAQGNIKATRISGLNSKVISATSGYFERLASGSIESDTIITNMLSAIELMAGQILADDIETNALTAISAKIIEATIDNLTASTVKTDALHAAFAELFNITAGNIKADKIETDLLAAAMANLTVLTAGSAEFDRATVEHLVSNLFNLTGSGVMEDVFIHNLKVAYAQMVSATIGNLVLKGKDGNYYEIDVNPEGKVTASLATVTEGEVNAGQTDGGKVIVATSMTVDDMNATTIKATHALVNKITAASIDTDELFANNAFINQLTTSRIYNDTSLDIVIDDYAKYAKWFKFDENGLVIRKPEYFDEEEGVWKTPIWSTLTDEKGYHVRSDEMVEPAGSFEGEGLTTPSVKIGEIRCKRTSTGGWVWIDA